jgi:hypothetical protein
MRYEPGEAVLRPVMAPDCNTNEDIDAGKYDLADHDKTADRRSEVGSIYDSVSTGRPLGIRNQGAWQDNDSPGLGTSCSTCLRPLC